jgi:hypothetical protein
MATPTIKNIAFGGATHPDGSALASGVPLVQGDTVWINVSMSSVAYLNEEQAPLEMLLQIGTSLSSARYYSGNGTTTWRFSYTIKATDVNDSNGISIPAGYLQRSGQNMLLGYAGVADNSAYIVATSDNIGGMPGTPAPYAAGSVPYLVATSDSGSSSKDNLTSAPRPTMRVNLIASGMAAGGKVELMEGTTVLGTVKLTQSHMDAGYVDITSSTLTDGAHALSARLTNQPLNAVTSGTLTVTIDTVAPVVTGATPDLLASSDLGISSTDNITSVTRPKMRIDLTATSGLAPGDKVDLMEGTTVLGTVTLTASHGNAGYVDITSPTLTDGVHTLSARLTDQAGNAASTSTVQVTIDTAAPVATGATPDLLYSSSLGLSSTYNLSSLPSPTMRVRLTATNGMGVGDKVELMEGTSVLGKVTLTTSDMATGYVDITSPYLRDGVHLFSTRLTDQAGNTDSCRQWGLCDQRRNRQ